MRAGDLRDRITVQSQEMVPDGQGGMTQGDWAAIAGMERIPANVEPLSGEERIAAMQTQANVDHKVELRYRVGVKAGHRAIWHAKGGDRVLYLTSAPVVIGNHEGLQFMAREDTDT